MRVNGALFFLSRREETASAPSSVVRGPRGNVASMAWAPATLAPATPVSARGPRLPLRGVDAPLSSSLLPRLQNPKARRRDEVVVLLRQVLAVLVVVDTFPLITLGDLLAHDFHRFFRDDPLPASLFPGQGVSDGIVVAAAVGPQVRRDMRVGFQLDADGVGVVVGRAGHGGAAAASSVPLVQCGFACAAAVSRWLAAALQEGYRLCGCAGGAASLAAQAADCECLHECYAWRRARRLEQRKNQARGWFASVLPPLAAHLPSLVCRRCGAAFAQP